ncbi:hypothetical protein [Terrilactibacillus laevilacticus]|uniref:LXG domain-containing protein n=1 Tax=Terrilactibacillus laevilacticus TaxID=1380157 RepID=A0ABW5PRI4_9BACI|nr:hypothetical protein [Terrilactibacillus laevilacticus]
MKHTISKAGKEISHFITEFGKHSNKIDEFSKGITELAEMNLLAYKYSNEAGRARENERDSLS